MSRARPPERLLAVIEHATLVFLAKGYRQAQVADVARSLGVAPGTVYLYVESKEALFDLVMRHALGTNMALETQLPVKRTDEASLFEFFRRTLDEGMRFPLLDVAPSKLTPKAARQELDTVVRELFRKLSKAWLALKLLERSAADWPELAALWFGTYRPRVFQQVAEYLARRMNSGSLRQVAHPMAAARLILEMIAAMAMHCRAEAGPQDYDAALMEELVADAVVHAYALSAPAANFGESAGKRRSKQRGTQ